MALKSDDTCILTSSLLHGISHAWNLIQLQANGHRSTFTAAQQLWEMRRYTWHLNELLKAVADNISTGIQLAKHQLPARCSTTFIWAGETAPYQLKTSIGSLALANDWQQKVGLFQNTNKWYKLRFYQMTFIHQWIGIIGVCNKNSNRIQ